MVSHSRVVVRVLTAGAALCVLILLVWKWLPSGPAPSDRSLPQNKAEGQDTGAGPTLGGVRTGAPTLKGGTDWQKTFRQLEASEHQSGLSSASIRVRGRIATSDGEALPEGWTAFVVTNTEPEWVRLLTLPVKQDTFEGKLDLRALGGVASVVVGVHGPGYAAERQLVRIDPVAGIDVQFEVSVGALLRGRVLDEWGKAVSGLALIAETRQALPMLISTKTLTTAARVEAPAGRAVALGRATTDQQGRFTIAGLKEAGYYLYSADNRWFLTPPGKLKPTYDESPAEHEILAYAAVGIDLTIVDHDTGELIAPISAMVQIRPNDPETNEYMTGMSSPTGRVHAFWRAHGKEIDAGFGASIQVKAPGYVSRPVQFAAKPGKHMATGEVRLKKEDEGTLELGVHDADGEPFGRKIRIDFVSHANRTHGHVSVIPEMIAPGRFRCATPAGRWFLRVYPDGALGRLISATAEIEVQSEQKVSTRIALLPFGSIQLRLDPDRIATAKSGTVLLTAEREGGEGSILSAVPVEISESIELPVVPIGPWHLRLQLGDRTMEADVTVTMGRTAQVDWR